jgi:hypothetical protein
VLVCVVDKEACQPGISIKPIGMGEKARIADSKRDSPCLEIGKGREVFARQWLRGEKEQGSRKACPKIGHRGQPAKAGRGWHGICFAKRQSGEASASSAPDCRGKKGHIYGLQKRIMDCLL